MILTICLTFVGTTMLYAAALFLACRRVMRPPPGQGSGRLPPVVEHVLRRAAVRTPQSVALR